MSEILQIFQHSSPPHHQMFPQIQRDLVHVESQFNWSMDSNFPSLGIFDVTDHFHCSELAGSPSTNSLGSSVDELSKVTAMIGHNQSLKKRKLEWVQMVNPQEELRIVVSGDVGFVRNHLVDQLIASGNLSPSFPCSLRRQSHQDNHILNYSQFITK